MTQANVSRVRLGFIVAAFFNFSILLVSRGFGDALGQVDPLFSPAGCLMIVLWGMAYFALRDRWSVVPGIAMVFALEKLFYAAHWALWISVHWPELGEMFAADPITATFFAGYGVGDALFMGFFGWVALRAWRTRDDTGA